MMTPDNRTQVLISVGTNLDRRKHLPEAIRLLRRNRFLDVNEVSRVFESPSVGGGASAPDFYNAAVHACTGLEPKELRDELRHIEAVLGRVRGEDPDAPRTIDLDIAYYDDLVDTDGLRIPDPDVLTAPHVAVPIADVAAEWVHPETSQTAYEIASALDTTRVRVVPDLHLMSRKRSSFDDNWDDDRLEVYAPRMEALVHQHLIEIGEDPEREGLLRTPLRVAKATDYITSGYATSLEDVVNNAIFDAEGADEIVLVKDIEFYSMCEHHMLPFFGKAAVAYLPDDKIIGLSKMARIVDLYARRLQVQERLTNQVARAVQDVLNPHGVAVVMDGRHLCMMMRGVQKQESSTVTSAMLGTFKSDARTRAELLDLL
ncbi:MAG: GTP cyclohydrolase I FolE [bacterium]|nr:GTP cyclohydrolase I FolE [bacterium]